MGAWLVAEQQASRSGKTSVWRLTNRESGNVVGFVGWYGPWRRYAFQPEADTVFESDCLAALSEFCARKTEEHRRKVKP